MGAEVRNVGQTFAQNSLHKENEVGPLCPPVSQVVTVCLLLGGYLVHPGLPSLKPHIISSFQILMPAVKLDVQQRSPISYLSWFDTFFYI